MTKSELDYHNDLHQRIKNVDAKLNLKQESYQARDVVVDDIIREKLMEKMKKKKRR